MSQHSPVSEYIDLIKSFVTGKIDAATFEARYLQKFKNDPTEWSEAEYEVLNDLFGDIDAFIRASTSYTSPTDYDANRGAIINSYSSQCTGICLGSSMPDNNGNLRQQDIQIPSASIMSSNVTLHRDIEAVEHLRTTPEEVDNPFPRLTVTAGK